MENAKQEQPEHFLLKESIGLLKAKRHREAVPLLSQYLRIHPGSEDGWFLLSYAIQEHHKKIDCIEQVLKINPNNAQARERLRILKDTIPEQRPPKKTKNNISIWIVAGISAVFLIIVSVAFLWGYRFINQSSFENNQQVAQQISLSTPSPTQTATPTITSSNTPTTTPPPTSTPTPSPTYNIPPTAFIIDEATSHQMDEIQNQVSALRNISPQYMVERNIISKEQVRPVLEAIYRERNSRDLVNDQARVLSTLGLIEPTYDLYSKTINQIGEGIGGFYIPWTDELYVIGTEFSGIERFVYSHEYTHALVDQKYSLENIGVYPECLSDADRCLAISALIEGDATYLMYQWLETYGTEDDIRDIVNAQYAPIEETLSSSNLPPPFVVREINFRYGDGFEFVDYLYNIGKWQMINLAYEALPQTTEQILHPDKFQIRETATPLEMPDLGEVLGDDWRFIAADTLGELGTEMILGYSAHRLAQLPTTKAETAATGWGGDNYQVYYKSQTNSSILVVHWIWDRGVEWEAEIEADEFWAAMWEYLDLRYRGDDIDTERGACWQLINDHFSCIFRSGLEVLWILSPDLPTIDLIREQYVSFR